MYEYLRYSKLSGGKFKPNHILTGILIAGMVFVEGIVDVSELRAYLSKLSVDVTLTSGQRLQTLM